jgi:hypothetical protein
MGVLAGYFRGWVDALIMRVMDIILAFPSLLLALCWWPFWGRACSMPCWPLPSCCSRTSPASTAPPSWRRRPRLCDGCAPFGCRPFAADAVDDPAELPGAADRAGDAELFQCHSGSRCTRLPRHGRPAADPRMGHDAGFEAREFILRAPWVVTFPGLAILITVLGHQPDRRRIARRARSQAEEELTCRCSNQQPHRRIRHGSGAWFRAVDGVDPSRSMKGEVLAIVGESGSGKSVAMLAVMGLLPWTAKITADDALRRSGPELTMSRPTSARSSARTLR